jgi:hypothetical protein
MKIIAIIPARAGSTSIKNKNLIKIKNKPLISFSIAAAKKSKLINEIYLSSDSEKILKIGTKLNIDAIKRQKNLSSYSASANSVILDFIKNNLEKNQEKNYIIVYLQPTSPFRNSDHIDNSINHFLKKKLRTLLSVTENKNFSIKIFCYDCLKIFLISYVVLILFWPQVYTNIFVLPYTFFIEIFNIWIAGPPASMLNGEIFLTSNVPNNYILLNSPLFVQKSFIIRFTIENIEYGNTVKHYNSITDETRYTSDPINLITIKYNINDLYITFI